MPKLHSSRRRQQSYANIDHELQDEDGLHAALERSQSVLEHQLEALPDLDTKAVWTVRLEIVLLGVLASAMGTTGFEFTGVWSKLGGVSLVCSIVTGVFTYSASRPDAGPGPRSVYSLAVSKAAAPAWYLKLLDGYDEAIEYNGTVIDHNARYLFRTQFLFTLGVVFIALGQVLST